MVTQVTTLLHYAGDCMESVGNVPTKKRITGDMSCVVIAMRLHTNWHIRNWVDVQLTCSTV
ncbi:MAG: hypothetical protein OEM28_11980 [Nitrosopumilus sp.]|nr:hypothetical protein [Nitrosopumilus sp.]